MPSPVFYVKYGKPSSAAHFICSFHLYSQKLTGSACRAGAFIVGWKKYEVGAITQCISITVKRGIKPENSKTVNQWGLRGRIPVDPLKPQYIWDNYYDVPQTIYYLEENTREMTEEEKADFRADRKVFSQRYVKLIADERERLRKKARETE